MLALGWSVELAVVAEGLEAAEQAAYVRETGCRIGQGLFYARPAPLDDLRGLPRSEA